jgi:hypothetical protein
MIKVTIIPEKKASVKRPGKATATSKVRPALSGNAPDGPVAAPARADGASASACDQRGTGMIKVNYYNDVTVRSIRGCYS